MDACRKQVFDMESRWTSQAANENQQQLIQQISTL